MGILKPNTRRRNTRILGNTHPFYKFLVLCFLIAFSLFIISFLAGCNSCTLSQNARHYQTRAVQVMHVTRDQSFGDENNTYYKLFHFWRQENAEERQQAYYQDCLSNLEAHRPKQLLSPGRSNSPVGISQPPSEIPAAALPIGTLWIVYMNQNHLQS